VAALLHGLPFVSEVHRAARSIPLATAPMGSMNRRSDTMLGNKTNTVRPADLRIDRSARGDWPTGAEKTPAVGQFVYCTEGMAEVTKVLGRTGDGSRLLELRLIDRTAPPFCAAASNVLIEPTPASGLIDAQRPDATTWIGNAAPG
jgi:hypothetical protein